MFGIKQIPLLFRMATTTDATVGVPTWSLTAPFPARRKSESVTGEGQCACGPALTGNPAVYNEEAFRYLLDIERKRFEASSEPFVLVLVDVRWHANHSDRMSATMAAKIFSTLTCTLRDTDVIGWYREHRIVGAILTHLGDTPLGDTTPQMSGRVTRALGARLPREIGGRLKVRLYRPRARMMS